MDANLLDAIVRLVRPLDAPTEAPGLQPLLTREIIYRLQEARRLMLGEDLDAKVAAYRVGYRDASQ